MNDHLIFIIPIILLLIFLWFIGGWPAAIGASIGGVIGGAIVFGVFTIFHKP